MAGSGLAPAQECGLLGSSQPYSLTTKCWSILERFERKLKLRSPRAFWIGRLGAILTLDAIAILATLRLTRAMLPGVRTLQSINDLWFGLALTVLTLAGLQVGGVYRYSWRYTTSANVLHLGGTLFASSVLIWLATADFIIPQPVHRAELFAFIWTHIALMMAAMIAIRLIRRGVREHIHSQRVRRMSGPQRRILLLGELQWAHAMINLVCTDPSKLEIVGVLTPDGRERNLRLGNVRIEGSPDQLIEIVNSLDNAGRRPSSLVVQESSELLAPQILASIATVAESLDLTVARFRPPWANSDTKTNGVEIERMPLADLLGRPEVAIQHSYVEQMVAGRRIMVTGAGGTIGGELVRQLATYGPAEIVLLDHSEYALYAIELDIRERCPGFVIHAELCSVRQRTALWQVFERRRPEIVFHAAALKHVPMVEANPCAGVHTNVLGTRNVADAACAFEVQAMVQVSTDKAVNPVGLMGATKRLGELYCQALDLIGSCDPDSPRFLTVRFGNVLGSSGSLIPLFQRQLAAGKPLTVTHPDIERFFMTVQEAVLLILQSSARALQTDADRGTIFVLDMGEPLRIVDIAKRLIRMKGLRPDIDVPIKFIGLRPGEKLYEELFDSSEAKIESAIPGIFEAMPSPIPLHMLIKGFNRLQELIDLGDTKALTELTHALVGASSKSRWAEMLKRLDSDHSEKTAPQAPSPDGQAHEPMFLWAGKKVAS
ncbi:nucleoside-diphosphate sugar epimerase/dehydratase [Novosphingobium sp. RD2P27]|uniref:Nucleoside-diphosphate sugar epimerase/dehydratase n=1 Tax=Novosphingobium kalidii TaxID=3230299 RepID=A0ABV2D483_9SPHN